MVTCPELAGVQNAVASLVSVQRDLATKFNGMPPSMQQAGLFTSIVVLLEESVKDLGGRDKMESVQAQTISLPGMSQRMMRAVGDLSAEERLLDVNVQHSRRQLVDMGVPEPEVDNFISAVETRTVLRRVIRSLVE